MLPASAKILSIHIPLCHLLYHATLIEARFVVFNSDHSASYVCHKTFQSTFEARHCLPLSSEKEEMLEI